MNRFIKELMRLYFLPEQEWQSWQSAENGEPDYLVEGKLSAEILGERLKAEGNTGLNLISPSGRVRSMLIGIERGSYWEQLAALYQGIQEDFDLPAPAVAVSVEDGYQIWFSLAEPVPLAQAQAFLAALQRKYLADIPAHRLKFRPGINGSANADSLSILALMPTWKTPSERWSAFIDPSMGSMFINEPWLEMAPNLDKQAAMLAGLESIRADDFQRVLATMQAADNLAENAAGSDDEGNKPNSGINQLASPLGIGSSFADPKDFLMAVMNDGQVSVRDRIEAARALLPYFENLGVK